MVGNLYQYYATFAVSLCIISSAMHLSWASPAIPKLQNGSHIITLTSTEASWLATVSLIGSIFGGPTAGYVIQRFGRIKPINFCFIPHTITWLSVAFCSEVVVLFGCRFLVGFTDSFIYTAIPMYIGEISDPEIRGFLCGSIAVSIVIGYVISNALGSYLSIYTTALISLSVPVLMIVTCWNLPESPYFLIQKNQDENAIKSLKKFKTTEDLIVQKEFQRLKAAIEDEKDNQGSFLDLFKVKQYRKAWITVTVLRCSQNLVGLSAITFYTNTIFSKVETGISAELWVILFYIVKLIMTLLSTLIMDKTGRKVLLYISITGVCFSLLCVGLHSMFEDELKDYEFIPIVALFVYVVTYSVGMGPIPVLMLGELLPTCVKAYALVCCDVSFCILGTAAAQLFQITNDNYGLSVPFMAFAFCAFLVFFFVLFFTPETKGKTLEEIQEFFKKK